MSWKPRESLWDWRGCLTAEEAKIIAASDKAQQAIKKAQLEYVKKFSRERMIVVNRAIQRAKYRALTTPPTQNGKTG